MITDLPPAWRSPLSQLGFGAAQISNLYREIDDATAADAVNATWEGGIRYFDTAPHYGLGLSERRLGQALRDRPRDEFVVSTKVGRLLRPNPHLTADDLDNGFAVPGTLTRERNFTAAGVERSLAESRERLGLDRVDIVWLHDPEEPTDRFDEAMSGAVPYLEGLRDRGVIGAWGVGSKDPQMLRRFIDTGRPDLVMVAGRYTLLEQDDSLMAACHEHGVGVVAVGVFNSGLLSRPRPAPDARYEYGQAPSALIRHVNAIADVCERHGVTLPEVAVAFPRRHPAVVNVCLGMRTRAQVDQNLRLTRGDIPDDLWDDLTQARLIKEN